MMNGSTVSRRNAVFSLTKKYVQERIIALSNVNKNQTKKFIETWGPSHHERTLGWFQKAAQELDTNN